MTIEEIQAYILDNFENIKLSSADGNLFFMHPSNDKLPFATILTKDDEYDAVSNLDRDGFYRLNFCIDKEIFKSKFGHLTHKKGLESYMDVGIDFTKEDTLLPHPTYGSMNWVCVVKPSKELFDSIKEYLESSFETLKRNKN
ncbi:DUF6194 family protein [Ulvibacter litoralis]|uniref:DUF6194 domain-containing protein n=1 Tax=Ulvibacter litoralis TaxID=227084 RepID=A0A1G7IGV1_9FLAO|nr:DUF6194 family protein [Ulvibacter litoralis]GHC60788.1 hypothetical protein GCM10008083_27260 [Ulvibacter litoralis]SDF11937.1 hypothetical protein SAMN05421855_1063 [Ulvibacter litoralis]